MNITLNTRTLVGHDHDKAADFAAMHFDLVTGGIDWRQSPSARCVLDITPDDQVLRVQFEQELRVHLGLPPYLGDDPSESETGSTTAQVTPRESTD